MIDLETDLGIHLSARSGRRLNNAVARELALQIVSGRIAPNALLPTEAELSERLSVSRTALREGLRILGAKGFLTARPKVGTTVNASERWNILDPDVLDWYLAVSPDKTMITALFELRRIIEPASSALAAERHGSDDAVRMAEAFRAMAEAEELDARVAADIEFHASCIHAAHNPALVALIPSIGATVLWSAKFKLTANAAIYDDSLSDHESVLVAILDRDAAAAEARMAALIDSALVDTLRLIPDVDKTADVAG